MENDDTKKMLLGIVHTSGKKTYLLSVLERTREGKVKSFFSGPVQKSEETSQKAKKLLFRGIKILKLYVP
jgi:hypothetical protein